MSIHAAHIAGVFLRKVLKDYPKTIRLHKARMLMAVEGLYAIVAAGRTVNQNPSQFSRESNDSLTPLPRKK